MSLEASNHRGPMSSAATDPGSTSTTATTPTVDEQIVAAIAAGDGATAFALVQATYGRLVDRLALKMVRDRVLAEDVRQIALLQIFRDLGTLRAGANVRAWASAVVIHRALDELKKRRRQERRQVELDDGPAAAGVGPEDALAIAEQWRAVAAGLERLPPGVRAALVLRFGQGRSFDEIGRRCGEAADTVRARVARALPHLRRCLTRCGISRRP